MGRSSDNGNAHTSIDIAAVFGVGFLPLRGEHGGKFLQQDLGLTVAEFSNYYVRQGLAKS
jgi:hypothetical protein